MCILLPGPIDPSLSGLVVPGLPDRVTLQNSVRLCCKQTGHCDAQLRELGLTVAEASQLQNTRQHTSLTQETLHTHHVEASSRYEFRLKTRKTDHMEHPEPRYFESWSDGSCTGLRRESGCSLLSRSHAQAHKQVVTLATRHLAAVDMSVRLTSSGTEG